MTTQTKQAPVNPHFSEFLTDNEITADEFSSYSPESACHLLESWGNEQIENFGVESAAAAWSAKAQQDIHKYAEREKALTVSAPPVQSEPEPVKPESAPFVDIETEIMPEEPDAIPEPPVTGDMGFRAISQRLAVTCQKVVTKDLASIVHDAMGGRVALPPVFLSGFAGLGKTFAVDMILNCWRCHLDSRPRRLKSCWSKTAIPLSFFSLMNFTTWMRGFAIFSNV